MKEQALPGRNPRPTREEITRAMNDNLWRCA